MSNRVHYSVVTERECLSLFFQTRVRFTKLKTVFWFWSQELYSPGYLLDPYTTHHLQSGAFHWSKLRFHPHHDWTAGVSEILPASISFQSFELSDDATCTQLNTHTAWRNSTEHGMFNSYKTVPKRVLFPSVSASQLRGQYWPVQHLVASVSNDAFGIMVGRDQLVSKGLQDSNFLFLLKTEASIRSVVPWSDEQGLDWNKTSSLNTRYSKCEERLYSTSLESSAAEHIPHGWVFRAELYQWQAVVTSCANNLRKKN